MSEELPPHRRLIQALANPQEVPPTGLHGGGDCWCSSKDSMTPKAATLVKLVMSLWAWDLAVRESRLFDGHVYMASDEACAELFRLTALEAISLHEVGLSLFYLYANELIYRFPVSTRFKAGYGKEKQFRLNCWGRLLAHGLPAEDLEIVPESYLAKSRCILDEHREDYARHFALLDDSREGDGGRGWMSQRSLPVGVLI